VRNPLIYLASQPMRHLLLSLPVIHKSNLQHRRALRNHHPPRVISLPINNSEPPNLLPSPPLLLIHYKTLNVPLAIGATILLFALQPPLLQESIWDLGAIDCDPAGLALQVAEQVVVVRAFGPVELAEFGGAFDAASSGLLDVDVCVPVLRGVLFAVESDGGEGDGFAGQPADALEGEYGVGVVREGLVLRGVLDY